MGVLRKVNKIRHGEKKRKNVIDLPLKKGTLIDLIEQAEIAQLVEQRFRKAWVVGSSPTFGSVFSIFSRNSLRFFFVPKCAAQVL